MDVHFDLLAFGIEILVRMLAIVLITDSVVFFLFGSVALD